MINMPIYHRKCQISVPLVEQFKFLLKGFFLHQSLLNGPIILMHILCTKNNLLNFL